MQECIYLRLHLSFIGRVFRDCRSIALQCIQRTPPYAVAIAPPLRDDDPDGRILATRGADDPLEAGGEIAGFAGVVKTECAAATGSVIGGVTGCGSTTAQPHTDMTPVWVVFQLPFQATFFNWEGQVCCAARLLGIGPTATLTPAVVPHTDIRPGRVVVHCLFHCKPEHTLLHLAGASALFQMGPAGTSTGGYLAARAGLQMTEKIKDAAASMINVCFMSLPICLILVWNFLGVSVYLPFAEMPSILFDVGGGLTVDDLMSVGMWPWPLLAAGIKSTV